MDRRDLVLLALLSPAPAARAQPAGRVTRIGILSGLAPGGRDYLEGGGLASYQSDFVEVFRRGADQIDKTLKGGKPGEIPFQQATKLVLVVNLKAARALGIAVPQSLLLTADEVIE